MVKKQELRSKIKEKILLVGDTGVGKTYTAVKVADYVASHGKRVVYIDTERGAGRELEMLSDEVLENITYVDAPEWNSLERAIFRNDSCFLKVLDGISEVFVSSKFWLEDRFVSKGKYQVGEKEVEITDRQVFTLPWQSYSKVYDFVRKACHELVKQSPHIIVTTHSFGTTATKEGLEKDIYRKFDSVAGYNPITIRDANMMVEVLEIEEFWNKIQSPIIFDGQREIKKVSGYTIFTPTRSYPEFTGIKAISRHWYEGDLVRIITLNAVVDVTPNHSIVSGSTYTPKASEMKRGDKVCVLPSFEMPPLRGAFIGTIEYAWLLGYFAADGHSNPKNANIWQVTSYDEELRGRLLDLAEQTLYVNSNIRVDGNEVKVQNPYIARKFREMFYSPSGRKKVPVEVLNAPLPIRGEFLDGYLTGDGFGLRADSNSWALLQGLIFMTRDIYPYWSIADRDDKPMVMSLIFRRDLSTQRILNRQYVKKVKRVPYRGYVYDVWTNSGRFSAGIGPVTVYNTILELRRTAKSTPPSLVYDAVLRKHRGRPFEAFYVMSGHIGQLKKLFAKRMGVEYAEDE